MYNPDGTWFKEGHGVDPDIEVKEDPTKLAKGVDLQLEKAIENVMQQMKEKGPIHPQEPAKENRTKRVIKAVALGASPRVESRESRVFEYRRTYTLFN